MSLEFNEMEQQNTPENTPENEISKTDTSMDTSSNPKQKTAIIAMGAGIVLLIILGILYTTGFFSSKSAPDNTIAKVSSNLPTQAHQPANTKKPTQKPEKAEESVADKNTTLQNPFAGPYTLSGVVLNSTGRNVAILSLDNKKLVIPEKEMVDDSWTVQKVYIDKVELSFRDKTQVLMLE